MIGFLFVNQSWPDTRAVDDGDTESCTFGELITNHVAELGAIGNTCGNAYLTASDSFFFIHGDLMTLTCRCNCGLQTRWTCPSNHDFFRLGGDR